MILDCVLTAVNDNPLYIDFIPIFIRAWKKLYPSVDIKIVLISKSIPEDLEEFKNFLILFEPIDGVFTGFTAQFIRLLYPCILNYENGVMITDMDMLPMNRSYYTENIKPFGNDNFIYLRGNVLLDIKQLAMCYNVATPKVWSEIFNIKNIEDIKNLLIEVTDNNVIEDGIAKKGWCIDQLFLFEKVIKWNLKTNRLICLNEKYTNFKRLDRSTLTIINNIIVNNIKNGYYSDYHAFRPMSKFKELNYKIIDLL